MFQKKKYTKEHLRSKKGLKSFKKGHLGEKIAAFYLILKGYRLLELNFKSHCGEIDIIAKKGNFLIAIEVKTHRKNIHESIKIKQVHRILKSLQIYQNQSINFSQLQLRFDVIHLSGLKLPNHIKNALEF